MSRMESNTAEQPVVMQEVKTLRSRVNVIIWHVRSRFGSSLREVPLAWPAENAQVDRPSLLTEDASAGCRGEVSKEKQL